MDLVPDPTLPEKFLGYSRESNSGPFGWHSDVLTTIPNRWPIFIDTDINLLIIHCFIPLLINDGDHLFGIVVSKSDCHPRGPGFDSRLYSRNFSGSIGYGTGSTEPREDNWVAT